MHHKRKKTRKPKCSVPCCPCCAPIQKKEKAKHLPPMEPDQDAGVRLRLCGKKIFEWSSTYVRVCSRQNRHQGECDGPESRERMIREYPYAFGKGT